MKDYSKELKDLILTTIKEGASDLHLSAGRHPTLRISGSLVPLLRHPILSSDDTEGLITALIDGKENADLKKQNEIDFSYSFEDKSRFRVNVFRQRGYWGSALRLIPNKIRGVQELNLPEKLIDFTKKEQGFFLVVGPIGQGKSTTLAAMIDYINHNSARHIVTIEDPMEYLYNQDKSIIDQREIQSDTADFKTAMRAMFRQDINVAMIGEMRDVETISTAVTAAETGHLVFSSLHTNSIAQTVDRIIDSFPAGQQNQIRVQLAGALLGIFSQRLIPKISGGRVPAYELLISNTAVRTLIRENRTHELDIVMETHQEEGMISLNKSLSALVRNGDIEMKAALNYSLNPKALEALM